jgi:hypothetical protein
MKKIILFSTALCLLVSQVQATIARVQTKTSNSGSSNVTSLTNTSIVLNSAPTNGNILVLVAAVNSANGNCQIVQPSDGSITWTYWGEAGASNVGIIMGVGMVYSGASATINVNAVTTGGIAMVVEEYTITNPVIDQRASNTGTSTGPSSGFTNTTTGANELWIVGISDRVTNGTTFSSPTNSFSIVGQDHTTVNATTDRSVALLDKIVTSTGVASSAVTAGASAVWIGATLTIKEVAGSTVVIVPDDD